MVISNGPILCLGREAGFFLSEACGGGAAPGTGEPDKGAKVETGVCCPRATLERSATMAKQFVTRNLISNSKRSGACRAPLISLSTAEGTARRLRGNLLTNGLRS